MKSILNDFAMTYTFESEISSKLLHIYIYCIDPSSKQVYVVKGRSIGSNEIIGSGQGFCTGSDMTLTFYKEI